jgi:hypothetical protein
VHWASTASRFAARLRRLGRLWAPTESGGSRRRRAARQEKKTPPMNKPELGERFGCGASSVCIFCQVLSQKGALGARSKWVSHRPPGNFGCRPSGLRVSPRRTADGPPGGHKWGPGVSQADPRRGPTLDGPQMGPEWAPGTSQGGVSAKHPSWVPGGSQMGPRWVPSGSQVGPRWVPKGSQMGPKRTHFFGVQPITQNLAKS